MSEPTEGGDRGERRPPGPVRGPRPPAPGPGRKPVQAGRGGLKLSRIGGPDFEIVHPRCVREMELDYEEGIELWRAGDVEAARDALRYALQGCGDNLWVHVALGRIALDEFKDATLARGHFGYAYELAQRALPPHFEGRLPPHRPANRPFYEAIEGLALCYDALQNPDEAAQLRRLAAELSGARGGPKGAARGGMGGRP